MTEEDSSVIRVTQVMTAPAATPLNIIGIVIFQNVLNLLAALI